MVPREKKNAKTKEDGAKGRSKGSLTTKIHTAVDTDGRSIKLHLTPGQTNDSEHWAIASSIIETCRLNHVEPFAYLKDVLKRMVSGQDKANQIDQIMPWNWRKDGLSNRSRDIVPLP